MNITIVAFVEEFLRRDEFIHDAELRILYPDTPEEAAVQYQELLLQSEEEDRGRWEITVLLNGRESDTDEEEVLARAVKNPGEEAQAKAIARRRAKERRLAEERQARLAREEEARKERQEREDRATFERLKQKYAAQEPA